MKATLHKDELFELIERMINLKVEEVEIVDRENKDIIRTYSVSFRDNGELSFSYDLEKEIEKKYKGE